MAACLLIFDSLRSKVLAYFFARSSELICHSYVKLKDRIQTVEFASAEISQGV